MLPYSSAIDLELRFVRATASQLCNKVANLWYKSFQEATQLAAKRDQLLYSSSGAKHHNHAITLARDITLV